ncbi:MAG: hypothetical protein KF713_17390 [Turneriella sp.]|nr:hypothetical protein [Turneriella sp.]
MNAPREKQSLTPAQSWLWHPADNHNFPGCWFNLNLRSPVENLFTV